MKHKYLSNVATLKLNEETCIGCGRCTEVCPHGVFTMTTLSGNTTTAAPASDASETRSGRKAIIRDLDSCMECGACTRNCPVHAIEVTPGTGCVYAVLKSWVNKLLGRPDTGEC